MSWNDTEDTTIYAVVLNDEEQYSIWPDHRDLPEGWRKDGTVGTKEVCLKHIDEVWTDMRPKSVRERHEKLNADGATGE